MRQFTVFIYVLLACIAVMLSCTQLTESQGRAVLTGRVTDEDTTVYLGSVKVYEASHARLSTVTDSLGYFRLEGVYFEEHNIYFEKEGYEKTILNFEYSGPLKSPVIARHIVMKKTAKSE